MQIPHLNINVSTTSIHTALEKYLSFPLSWEQNSALLATSAAAKAAFPALCKPVASFTQALALFVLEHIPFFAQSETNYHPALLHPALRRLADCSILDDKVPLPALALIFILGVLLLPVLALILKRVSRKKCSTMVVPVIITPSSAHAEVKGGTIRDVSHQMHETTRSIGVQTELDNLCLTPRLTEKDTDGRFMRKNFSFMTPPTTPDQCMSRPTLFSVTTPKKVSFADLDQPTTFVRPLPVVDTPTPLAGAGGTLSRLPIRAALKVKHPSGPDGRGALISDPDVQSLQDGAAHVMTQQATPPQLFSFDLESPSPLSPRQRKRQRQMARNKAKTKKGAALAV